MLKKSSKIKSPEGTKNWHYASYEIMKGLPYTSKCDIWSIGVIFYELLHGRTPWTGKSEYELLQNIETKRAVIDEGFGKNTVDFLSRALQVKEDSRMGWNELFAHPIFNGSFSKTLLQYG